MMNKTVRRWIVGPEVRADTLVQITGTGKGYLEDEDNGPSGLKSDVLGSLSHGGKEVNVITTELFSQGIPCTTPEVIKALKSLYKEGRYVGFMDVK